MEFQKIAISSEISQLLLSIRLIYVKTNQIDTKTNQINLGLPKNVILKCIWDYFLSILIQQVTSRDFRTRFGGFWHQMWHRDSQILDFSKIARTRIAISRQLLGLTYNFLVFMKADGQLFRAKRVRAFGEVFLRIFSPGVPGVFSKNDFHIPIIRATSRSGDTRPFRQL